MFGEREIKLINAFSAQKFKWISVHIVKFYCLGWTSRFFHLLPPLSSLMIIFNPLPQTHTHTHTTPYTPSPCLCRGSTALRWGLLLPSSSSFTSLAAVRPSSLRFFSMALLRSRAALSSALRVHPMVREHSLNALPIPGSTAEMQREPLVFQ